MRQPGEIRAGLAFVGDEPPVIVDWLPWNHTFGSNHNFNLVLDNGGSLYIDEGKPLPGAIAATARNLQRDRADDLLQRAEGLRNAAAASARPMRRCARTSSAGSRCCSTPAPGSQQYVWDELQAISVATCGERIIFISSIGSTETAPLAIACNWDYRARRATSACRRRASSSSSCRSDGKLEARLKGPNITPGYWRRPDLTSDAFDEEGYYRIGDALKFADPADPSQGLLFDGRIAEDFKLVERHLGQRRRVARAVRRSLRAATCAMR